MGERIFDQDMRLLRADSHLHEKTCEEIEKDLSMMTALQPTITTEETSEGSVVVDQQDDILELDKGYDSMRAIRMAAIEYGRRRNFAVSTLRSGERQLVLACKHSGSYRGAKKTVEPETDFSVGQVPSVALVPVPVEGSTKRTRTKVSRKIQCPFQLRAKPVRGQWVIYKLVLEHNHLMAADSNAYAQHRKLDEETHDLIIKLMKTGSTNAMIVKYLSLKGIRNVVKKDIANLRQTVFNPNYRVNPPGTLTYRIQPMVIPSPQDQQQQQLEEEVQDKGLVVIQHNS